MNKNMESVVKLLKKRMDKYISKFGMENGYETSFGDTIISKNVVGSHMQLKTVDDEVTFGELRDIGIVLYKDLHSICINNFNEFKTTDVRIFSKYIEHGCYRHYISFTRTFNL